MNGTDRRAYDRGITIFSPDGRLYQVDYAREAVKQGSPSVGVRTDEGVVLAAHKPERSPLVEPRSVEKLHAVDEHVAVATAGHAADGRRLVEVARRTAQRERLRYGEPAPVEALATAVCDHVQEHTQSGGARPYGTALLVAGYDPDDGGDPGAGDGSGSDAVADGDVDATDDRPGRARLFETDPSGTSYEWQATAVGRDAGEITEHFEAEYAPGLTLSDGLTLALSGLATAAGELTAATVGAGTVTADGHARVEDGRLRDAIAAVESVDEG